MVEANPNSGVMDAAQQREAYSQQLLARLMAEDPEFRAAAPDPAVAAAKSAPGLTLAQILATALEGYADRPCLGQRAKRLVTDPASGRSTRIAEPHLEVLTYREVNRRVCSLANVWHDSASQPLRANQFLLTLGFASIDYVTVLLAGIRLGAVLVPVQAGGVTAQLQAILDEVKPAWFAVSGEYLLTAVDLILAGHRPAGLLLFDHDGQVDDDRERLALARERLAGAGLADMIVTIDEAMARGEALPSAPVFAEPDSDQRLCTIYYTSGSTGLPKGAMLPEVVLKVPVLAPMSFPGIFVHFMPMNHSYGPSTLYRSIANGGVAYLTKSDLSELLEDFRLARPTTIPMIPRLCEIFYSQFQLEYNRRLGTDSDAASLRQRMLEEWRQERLGGRFVRVSFASAPLTPTLKAFVMELFGVPLDESFGSTEVSGVLYNSRVTRPPVIAYKLVDVPELGYYTTDKPNPRGELLVRTETIMLGYYNQPELTAKAFDEEGFYRTGDIMEEIGPDQLIYVDRRNNVLKLAQAEFVAVQRLEGLFSSSPLISQTFIYGTSTRSFLLAVLVPDAGMVRQMGLEGNETALRAALRDAIQAIAQTNELQSYEVPRDFIVEHEPFSVENRLLTASAKFARPNLTAAYAPRLEAMYDEIAARQTSELERLRAQGSTAGVLETVLGAAQATLGLESIDPEQECSFADLGGDSLASLSFSLLLGDIFGVDVPVGVITNPASSLHDLARYIERMRASSQAQPTFASVHGAGKTIRASDLTLEKFLGADVVAQAATAAPQSDDIRTVLVTGSTGFLGRFLCLEWLERMAATGGKVIAIVRGRDNADASRRLFETYDSGDADLKAHFAELAAKHLEVLNGDLAEFHMGLSAEDWQRCAADVDLIVHPAAFVNHILPYNQLFGPNVVGTAELIRLAISVKRKPISNVSTMAVAFLPGGGRVLDEHADVRSAYGELDTGAEGYAVGYGMSKWAAEVLLREAHDRLGLQVSIYRCDMILAHSRFIGQLNIPDLFTRLLLSVTTTGLAPGSFYQPADHAIHYDGLPVDFIAHTMAELDLSNRNGVVTYHVTNPHDDGISLDTFVDWMIEDGLPIVRIADYQDWFGRFSTALKALPEHKRQQTSLPLLHQLQKQNVGHAGAMLPADRFQAAVREKGLGPDGDIPHLGAALIRKYIADLRATGLLEQ